MGRKKKKKVNAKAERYAKFHKEKPANTTFVAPDLTPEQMKQRQEDEQKISFFLRRNRNPPTKEISERKMRSKR
ncbi:hypothetical protein JXB11_03090 [Candidatus Woesearchaeota archaeon]|nr:hypothetical protein [Candidatus Woesearchaeota archaeon]